jgi:hypothetical protein
VLGMGSWDNIGEYAAYVKDRDFVDKQRLFWKIKIM